MRSVLAASLFVVIAVSGCIDDNTAGTDSTDTMPEEAVEPLHVDESFDLRSGNLDESWSWTMSPDMDGHVTIERIPDPVAKNDDGTICYDLTWPQGRQSSCATTSGGLSVSIEAAGMVQKRTVFDSGLHPNSFDLRVWTDSGPDTAKVRVYIKTWNDDT